MYLIILTLITLKMKNQIKPKISVVINVDTRPENLVEGQMGSGVTSMELIVEGINNKVKFFKNFDIELILYVDVHEDIHPMSLAYLTRVCDKVCFSRHVKGKEKQNDYNYLKALQLASGDYIAHFDMDMAAFTRDEMPIWNLINLLETYTFVSYPAQHSPAPCHDDSFDYWWVSTRFFMCKRRELNFHFISKCLEDIQFFNRAYPSTKNLHWFEHILGRIAKENSMYPVIYPTMDLTNYAIWSWESYLPGTLSALNTLNYDDVGLYINKCGGIHYPCNLNGKKEIEK